MYETLAIMVLKIMKFLKNKLLLDKIIEIQNNSIGLIMTRLSYRHVFLSVS